MRNYLQVVCPPPVSVWSFPNGYVRPSFEAWFLITRSLLSWGNGDKSSCNSGRGDSDRPTVRQTNESCLGHDEYAVRELPPILWTVSRVA